ncbi:hypothetical protein RvY_15172-2 [Ramazzottius varieornatus]|uniref:Uncharacterized protein n=1 Tax=Ramazzottius varieornatus TaxID=947166 RepID=A0A1D1VTZ5_RAMVA|nr:hypothetical protein RvY_15172-2 [Ramazzottius varieornatus]
MRGEYLIKNMPIPSDIVFKVANKDGIMESIPAHKRGLSTYYESVYSLVRLKFSYELGDQLHNSVFPSGAPVWCHWPTACATWNNNLVGLISQAVHVLNVIGWKPASLENDAVGSACRASLWSRWLTCSVS